MINQMMCKTMTNSSDSAKNGRIARAPRFAAVSDTA
jgi:hypothetical protein